MNKESLSDRIDKIRISECFLDTDPFEKRIEQAKIQLVKSKWICRRTGISPILAIILWLIATGAIHFLSNPTLQ